jgi:hypothetical protein
MTATPRRIVNFCISVRCAELRLIKFVGALRFSKLFTGIAALGLKASPTENMGG